MFRRIVLILVTLCFIPASIGQSQVAQSVRSVNNNDANPGLYLVDSDENGVIVTLNTPEYTISDQVNSGDTFQKLKVSGYASTGIPGEPQIPLVGAMVGVPADATVQLHVLDDTATPLLGTFHLSPVPRQFPPADDFNPGSKAYLPDTQIYTHQALYPDVPARIVNDAWLRDQRIIRFELYPFQYNPAEGSLLWHRSLRVQVSFVYNGDQQNQPNGLTQTLPDQLNPDLQGDLVVDPFEAALKSSLLNYQIAKQWRDTQYALHEPGQSDRLFPTISMDTTPAYKIVVDHDGIYQLTYADLQAAGVPVDTLDPRNFHLTSQGQDVAIYVAGEDDGKFDPEDTLNFYGQKFYGDTLAQLYTGEDDHWMSYYEQLPDGGYTTWQPHLNATMLEKYTDENVYWLTVDGPGGPRMAIDDGTPHDTAQAPEYYTTTVHTEQSHEWYTYNFSSEDTWYWARIRNQTQRVYTTTLTAVASVPFTATVRADVAARVSSTAYNPDHHTVFYINSSPDPLDDHLWSGISRYHVFTQVSQSQLVEGENQLKLNVVFDAYPGQVTDDIYFDWFEIEYARLFQAENNQITFSRNEGGTTWQYDIGNFTDPGAVVFDVTDPYNPRQVLNPRLVGGTLSFEGTHADQVQYMAIGTGEYQTPKSITAYTSPDFSTPADYIFITHQEFVTETQVLADYRASQGLSTLIVNVDDLYNEFNYGIYNPIAIKNFIAYTFANWQTPPTYVLLIGDGHWNFKGYKSIFSPGLYDSPYPNFMPPNLAFVDPVQGEVDSANLLASVVGDDILPDVLIGRIPVDTVDQLSTVINKIIAYESTPPADWQRHLLFIADNPDDAGDFIALAEGIVTDYVAPPFSADRIYDLQADIDSGICALNNRCQSVNQEIMDSLNITGTLIMNYIGHASNVRWADESILMNTDIPNLTNGNALPIVLSMDCLDGFWTYPSVPSLMEDILSEDGGGAVSTFSPTGLGVATGHDALQRGIYTAIFQDGTWNLGAATLAGKLNLFNEGDYPDLIETFTIFGDPALHILSPYSPEVTPPTNSQSGLVGTNITYTLQVTNNGQGADTFALSLSGNTWDTTASSSSIGPIDPGASASVAVTVSIPPSAQIGASDFVTVEITSQGDLAKSTSAFLTTTATAQVVYAPGITPPVNAQSGIYGSAVNYPLVVTNNGQATDTFTLSVRENTWMTVASSGTIGPLDPGISAPVSVTVSIPPDSQVGVFDTATVVITSQSDPGKSASATLTTTVTADYVYLPLIIK